MIVTPQRARFDTALPLASSATLPGFEIVYESYGTLNGARDNAILVCHGLTSDQHAAGRHGATDARPGWWDAAIGPGKVFDTEHYFVLSTNALGGFGGSTGPASPDPATGRPYGMRFPLVTIGDMVAAQRHLADRLGIARFHTIAGGCMGGFQALEWLGRYPERVANAIVISATPRTTTHNLALWSVLRQAIFADPRWNGGDYYDGEPPDAGMALLAMIGALFWMSRDALAERFALRRVRPDGFAYSFAPEFEVEAFFAQVGRNAARKLDANALLYLTRAIDYFDLTAEGGSLAERLAGVRTNTLLVSYARDWRYPAAEMQEIDDALCAVGAPSRHVTLDSAMGHGAFLYEFAGIEPEIRAFLAAAAP